MCHPKSLLFDIFLAIRYQLFRSCMYYFNFYFVSSSCQMNYLQIGQDLNILKVSKFTIQDERNTVKHFHSSYHGNLIFHIFLKNQITSLRQKLWIHHFTYLKREKGKKLWILSTNTFKTVWEGSNKKVTFLANLFHKLLFC